MPLPLWWWWERKGKLAESGEQAEADGRRRGEERRAKKQFPAIPRADANLQTYSLSDCGLEVPQNLVGPVFGESVLNMWDTPFVRKISFEILRHPCAYTVESSSLSLSRFPSTRECKY